MGKYLDSIDYNKIVVNTFQLPESDFFKYYSNQVEDHIAHNPDMFDELIAAIERRIEWYRDQHPDDYSYNGKDQNGNDITIILDFDEADQVYIPLFNCLPGYNLRRSINKAFFDEQIKVVNLLSIKYNLKKIVDNAVDKNNIGKSSKRRARSFKDLFVEQEQADMVLKILTENEYITSGIWSYDDGDEKAIATPYYILRDYFFLIKPDGSSLGSKLKLWCSGLGVSADAGYIKNLTNIPKKRPPQKYKNRLKEFYKLFEYHFKPVKPLEQQ